MRRLQLYFRSFAARCTALQSVGPDVVWQPSVRVTCFCALSWESDQQSRMCRNILFFSRSNRYFPLLLLWSGSVHFFGRHTEKFWRRRGSLMSRPKSALECRYKIFQSGPFESIKISALLTNFEGGDCTPTLCSLRVWRLHDGPKLEAAILIVRISSLRRKKTAWFL